MKNKLLFLAVVILIPITILIPNNENKIVNNDEVINNVIVNLNKNGEEIELNLNEYLIGVVGQEMPASFNMEALKAQAIASRTFAMYYLNNNSINATTTMQSYASIEELKNKWEDNFELYFNKIKQAVESTDKKVMKYDNKIIKSYYFSMSNGQTEDVMTVFNEDLPYLTSVDSSFDSNQKNFEVTTKFNYQNFCNLLSLKECSYISISNIEKDNTNRVSKLTINNIEFSGIDIRKKLSLRSTDFDIKIHQDDIEIITKGYGHGVGMSQYGANYLANNGYNYEEILNYYYKDIVIEKY